MGVDDLYNPSMICSINGKKKKKHVNKVLVDDIKYFYINQKVILRRVTLDNKLLRSN